MNPSRAEAEHEFNRAINHAIELGDEAAEFLTLWREGEWERLAAHWDYPLPVDSMLPRHLKSIANG